MKSFGRVVSSTIISLSLSLSCSCSLAHALLLSCSRSPALFFGCSIACCLSRLLLCLLACSLTRCHSHCCCIFVHVVTPYNLANLKKNSICCFNSEWTPYDHVLSTLFGIQNLKIDHLSYTDSNHEYFQGSSLLIVILCFVSKWAWLYSTSWIVHDRFKQKKLTISSFSHSSFLHLIFIMKAHVGPSVHLSVGPSV